MNALPKGYLSPHIRDSEFACNHCGELPYNKEPPQELLQLLEDLREHYGVPVIIHSGYRCPLHNKHVGGAVHSQHLLGTAADVHFPGVDPARVYAELDPYHSGGLGKYATFTHIDARDHRARWTG